MKRARFERTGDEVGHCDSASSTVKFTRQFAPLKVVLDRPYPSPASTHQLPVTVAAAQGGLHRTASLALAFFRLLCLEVHSSLWFRARVLGPRSRWVALPCHGPATSAG